MRKIIILALMATSLWGCTFLQNSSYTPMGCNRRPDLCRLCEPGEKWVPPGGCLVKPTEPTSSPSPTVTPSPSPTPQVTPTSPPPAPTATPTATVPATQGGDFRSITSPPWLVPNPPLNPVPVLGVPGAGCPSGFRRVGPDRNGRLGCVIDWTCAPGTNGRSPAEGANISLTGGHVIIDPSDGMVRDVDNGKRDGEDAWGRKVQDGVIIIPIWEGREEKFWAQWSACDPLPYTPTPTPTSNMPTPIPSTSCEVVEKTFHFMAPGNKCHGGGASHCVVDSTIRPICDRDHMENWNGICGGRDHDPDYGNPQNAFIWNIEGAEDLGPNPENAAQRIIRGEPGAHVKVQVCIPPNAKTPDGCVITPTGGGGCGVREFDLPSRGEARISPPIRYDPPTEPAKAMVPQDGPNGLDVVFLWWLLS